MKPVPRPNNQPQQHNQHIIQASAWSGPLPDPQSLQHFKAIIPDAPQIIFNEFVEQGKHQRWLGKCGSLLDFIVAVAAMMIIVLFAVAAFIFFWRGNGWAGSAFVATPIIVTLVKTIRRKK